MNNLGIKAEKTATELLFERRKKYVPNGIGVFSPGSAVEGNGAIITNAEGNKMIDFAGGIGVINAGHCPPKVVQAIQDQAAKLIHACFNVAIYEPYVALAEVLANLFPHGKNGTKVMLTNSGAEAVENAIKIARQATKRTGIVCFSGGFHGRTMMAMTLTSKVSYKLNCGPFAPEVYRLDFPYFGSKEQLLFTESEFDAFHIDKLHAFFTSYACPDNIAAFIVEVVQGEGGFTVISKKYLKELRKLCTEKGIILIFDEVQSGFGRTGAWAGYEHFDVKPDLSTWAKSMGSGMPIGCVIGKAEIMDAAGSSTIGGTYGGNPVCAAASLATIEYMKEIDINGLGKKVGDVTLNRFEKWKKQFPQIIGDVRGLGAMLAFELIEEGDLNRPNPILAKKIIEYCNENGLIIISAGINANVIRILSPLVIEITDLNKGLDILENALEFLS